jgi:hypothetical protein
MSKQGIGVDTLDDQTIKMIQAWGSIAAVGISLAAFYNSRKALQTSHRAMLKPDSVISSGSYLGFGISIKNIGPAIAYNVQIVLVGLVDLEYYSLIQAEGDQTIQSKEGRNYLIEDRLVIDVPFIIKYETLTGKRYTEIWKYNANNKFSRISYWEAFKYRTAFLTYRNKLPRDKYKNWLRAM